MFSRLLQLLYPSKCILCKNILDKNETDLCADCRKEVPEFKKSKRNIPFVAGWTALWYYEGNVRRSILRFKFYNARSYAETYGRMLAMKLLQEEIPFDVLTWAPISALRKWRRGYDQVELLAKAVGRELGVTPVRLLKKARHNRPQSGIADDAARRANQVIRSRTVLVMILLGVVTFLLLFWKLYDLQIIETGGKTDAGGGSG